MYGGGWDAVHAEQNMALLVCHSPYQRTIIQYPAIGHKYWTEETCMLVANRYAGWDPAPYLQVLQPGPKL
jgi:hypothetical protein